MEEELQSSLWSSFTLLVAQMQIESLEVKFQMRKIVKLCVAQSASGCAPVSGNHQYFHLNKVIEKHC